MIPRLDQLSALLSLIRDPILLRQEIVSFQNRQLQHLFAHGLKNVSYYSTLIDQNAIKPKQVQSV